jgi:hypothetical protein
MAPYINSVSAVLRKFHLTPPQVIFVDMDGRPAEAPPEKVASVSLHHFRYHAIPLRQRALALTDWFAGAMYLMGIFACLLY